jgi:hypothetical protein
MRIFLLLALWGLSACMPEHKSRANIAGISVSGEELQGIWYRDKNSEIIQMSYSLNNLRYVEDGILKENSIQFLSQSSYYDYRIGETFDFSVNGDQAQVCSELECLSLRRDP